MKFSDWETPGLGEDSSDDLQVIEQLYARTNESAIRKSQAVRATGQAGIILQEMLLDKSD